MIPAANRFDALRLAFALAVAVFHLVALAAWDPLGPWEMALGQLAELSIQGFFIVSGALVFASLERSRSVIDYAAKRARRLYPAYASVVIAPALAALAAGAAATGVLAYVAPNLLFLNFVEPELPLLFAGNRFSEVNGALWTIKVEVLFYMVLPALAWPLQRSGRIGLTLWLGALYLVGPAWIAAVQMMTDDPDLSGRLARQLPGQLSFFASGMALHLLRGRFGDGAMFYRVALACAALFALSWLPGLEVLRAGGLAGVIALAAYAPGPNVPAARWGDISYGVYLTHFPIVQGLVAVGLFQRSAILGAALALIATLAASLLLWWLVERPALRRTSHYRRVAVSPRASRPLDMGQTRKP